MRFTPKEIEEHLEIAAEAAPRPWRVKPFADKFEFRDDHYSEISNGTSNRKYVGIAVNNYPPAIAEIRRMRDIFEAIGKSCELLSGSQLRQMVENGLNGGMEWQAIYQSIQSVLKGGEE